MKKTRPSPFVRLLIPPLPEGGGGKPCPIEAAIDPRLPCQGESQGAGCTTAWYAVLLARKQLSSAFDSTDNRA